MPQPIHDKQKTDVFSSAMIVLEAATLSDINLCYDYYNGWFLKDIIQQKLNDMKLRYHDSIAYIVQDMLTEKEVERPTFQQLESKIITVENKLQGTIKTKKSVSDSQFQSVRLPNNDITTSVIVDSTTFGKQSSYNCNNKYKILYCFNHNNPNKKKRGVFCDRGGM